MLKIFMCDDEKTIYETVAEMLPECEKILECSCELTWFSSGQELLYAYDTCDILLLDIEMPQMDGFETARRLIDKGADCKIIMLTGNRERFKEAFKIGAFRYVTKPIEQKELSEALADARRRLIGRRELTIIDSGISYQIVEKDILYLMADRNTTLIYTMNHDFRSQFPIQQWAEFLDPHMFYQCHRSYLINLKYLGKISEKEARMTSGERVKVSRRKHNELVHRAVDYETRYH